MYRGFRITEGYAMRKNIFRYKISGNEQLYDQKEVIKKSFKEFLNSDNYLDGSGVQEEWFPQIKADIFISHSHADKDKALALAGYFYSKFGITSFIDSGAWGYADDLLKMLDKRYCYNEEANTYNYKMRNRSTSHVYIMLASALTSMIDKCECFLFLDTENSLQLSEYGEVTESPWIYYELAQSVTIRKKLPKRLRKHLDKKLLESRQILNLMQIHYRTDLGHLTELSITELQDLANDCQKSQENLLDALYDYFPIQ